MNWNIPHTYFIFLVKLHSVASCSVQRDNTSFTVSSELTSSTIQSEQTPEISRMGQQNLHHMGGLLSKGHLSGGLWHETVQYPWCLFIVSATGIITDSAEVLYLPVKVESLQQLYPALSGGHTVRRSRLHHLRAHHHISKHQQSSDGKPAAEPWMHTHSEYFLWVKRGRCLKLRWGDKKRRQTLLN